MNKVELKVVGLSYSHNQFQTHVLVLAEKENQQRRIPIVIGGLEAQSIAIHIEELKPPRPLTHDLFISMALAFDIRIVEVLIYKFERGIFYSELICIREDKKVKIDTRTSDAISLALRFNSPIYTYEEILERTTKMTSAKEQRSFQIEESHSQSENEYPRLTLKELKEEMEKRILNEDYEQAALIKKELDKRGEKE